MIADDDESKLVADTRRGNDKAYHFLSQESVSHEGEEDLLEGELSSIYGERGERGATKKTISPICSPSYRNHCQSFDF
jgi:hypothetical protein